MALTGGCRLHDDAVPVGGAISKVMPQATFPRSVHAGAAASAQGAPPPWMDTIHPIVVHFVIAMALISV